MKESTKIILTQKCNEMSEGLSDIIVMKNGDELEINQLSIKAIPAYNIVHKRDNGIAFHPKGEGNGYIISFSDTRVYVAGDTEYFPEMENMKFLNIVFLPMNLPYTMSPSMFIEAAKLFNPSIVYPYHFGSTDTSQLAESLADTDIEVRIRNF